MRKPRCVLAAVACRVTTAKADIRVHVIEGAPKDPFVLFNEGRCAVPPSERVIDLSGSTAGLICDVPGTGAGVDVLQSFELVEGASA